jgi:predicted  nucleic acid-binding Zn-ribbon protein
MPQLSKLIRSRDDWKTKAVQRADEIREHRKTIKRHQEQIAEIKSQIIALQQAAEDNKKNTLRRD